MITGIFRDSKRVRLALLFLIFLFILVVAGSFYCGWAKRQMGKTSATLRRAMRSKNELIVMRNERTALALQFAALPAHFPILTNRLLNARWQAAEAEAWLDPMICQSGRAYQKHVSAIALQTDPRLEFFLALQNGYGDAIERLALDWTIHDKSKALAVLQTNSFAVLFTNTSYLADKRRAEQIAQNLRDEQTTTLRLAYLETLADRVTNLSPQLAAYEKALVDVSRQSAPIARRLAILDAELNVEASLQKTERASTVANILQKLIPVGTVSTQLTGKDIWTVELVAAAVFFLLTFPVEFRENRWRKIIASLVLVYACLVALRARVSLELADKGENVFVFFGFLLSAAGLALIWTSVFANALAVGFMSLVDAGDSSKVVSVKLNSAYRLSRKGDFDEALATLRTSRRDPHSNYETLLLTAKLHRHLNHRWRAWLTLKRLSYSRRLTSKQRSHVNELLQHLPHDAHTAWRISPQKSPPPE